MLYYVSYSKWTDSDLHKNHLKTFFARKYDSETIVKLRSVHVKLCFIACSLTSLGSYGIISCFYAFLALIPWFGTGSMVSLIPSLITYPIQTRKIWFEFYLPVQN
jgi:hypothetical protein